MYINSDIESSYKENDIGQTLYDLVMEHKPKKIVEFGVLHGYSTVAMAQALKELGRGVIDAYDMWGKYPFKHSTMGETASNIANYGVSEYVNLLYGDLDTWLENPEDFDLLHVDISNTGDTIKKLHEVLKQHIAKGKIVVFEGGTYERDTVEWMEKYQKPKMYDAGVPYRIINSDFPSISQLI